MSYLQRKREREVETTCFTWAIGKKYFRAGGDEILYRERNSLIKGKAERTESFQESKLQCSILLSLKKKSLLHSHDFTAGKRERLGSFFFLPGSQNSFGLLLLFFLEGEEGRKQLFYFPHSLALVLPPLFFVCFATFPSKTLTATFFLRKH